MSDTDANEEAKKAEHTESDAAQAEPAKPAEGAASAAAAAAGYSTAAAAQTPPEEPVIDIAAGGAEDPRIAELEAERDQLKERLMRAAADVQNARKRAERDRKDAEAYGGTKLARDLLPVYDNLDQALTLATDELREKEPGFFNGVDLTRNELIKAFEKHKVQRISVEIGDKFDPNEHQAMFEAPMPGAAPGTVIQVMQAGFTIADRLLRPAMVGVARAAEGAPAAADGEAEADGEADAKADAKTDAG